MERTIADAFDRIAAQRGGRLAVCEPGERCAYADLRRRSENVSRCLAPLVPAPGLRVGLMATNGAAFVAGFYGIARLGGVVTPLHPRYRSQELTYYLTDARAAAVLVMSEFLATARAALALMAHPPALVEITAAGDCHVVATGRTDAVPAATAASPPLLHQYTSGSTGAPKQVIRTHANLSFELERLAQVFNLDQHDRLVGAAPFSHVNGLVRSMMTAMFVGGALYTFPAFQRREILRVIGSDRLTFFGGVPSMFVTLADTASRTAPDLSSLRTAFSASAPLLADDNRRFHARYGLYVRQLYGSTETGTISVHLEAAGGARLESVGRALPGVRIQIVDEERRPVPPDVEGEVAIASPAAIRGYPGNDAATAAAFRDDWYLSGDLGRVDAGGRLTLTGRKTFLINRGGFKVNPLEVETAIRSHAKVREVVVLRAPGLHGDDIVRCVIVANSPCTPAEIVQHCAGRIADFKIPSRIEFRDELPKSETGKVLRHQL